MLIYVLRHGITQWNKLKKVQGAMDIPLAPEGIELAKRTGEALKDVPFDICFTSPLARARQTAHYVLGNRQIPVIEDKRIQEIDFGVLEGSRFKDEQGKIISHEMEIFFEEPQKFERPQNGENISDILKRTREFWVEKTTDPALADKTILVSSHGCAVRALLQNVYQDPEHFWHGCVPPNCSINLLEVKDGPDTEMTCSRNNKRLLYMGNKDLYMGKTAYAVMEDLDRPDIRMISRLDLSNRSDYISISNDTILPTEKAFKAEMFTLSQTEEVLYFVAEGKLWARHIAGKHGQEKEQFTIPSGETVSFLKYLKYKEENIDYNYVVLGTQLGTQYKIRFFAKLSGGNIDPHPEVILPREGESASGHAGDVLYVSPKMYDNSYIHTF